MKQQISMFINEHFNSKIFVDMENVDINFTIHRVLQNVKGVKHRSLHIVGLLSWFITAQEKLTAKT